MKMSVDIRTKLKSFEILKFPLDEFLIGNCNVLLWLILLPTFPTEKEYEQRNELIIACTYVRPLGLLHQIK